MLAIFSEGTNMNNQIEPPLISGVYAPDSVSQTSAQIANITNP